MTVERRLHLRSQHPSPDAVLQAPALSSTSAYPFDAAPFWWLWNAQQWHRARPVALRRRTVMLALVTWLPLVLLTAQQRGAGQWAHWLEPLTDIRIISRYLLAKKFGIRSGVDVAVGTGGKPLFYLQNGAAWK